MHDEKIIRNVQRRAKDMVGWDSENVLSRMRCVCVCVWTHLRESTGGMGATHTFWTYSGRGQCNDNANKQECEVIVIPIVVPIDKDLIEVLFFICMITYARPLLLFLFGGGGVHVQL